jgi:hypothetical protein
MPPPLKAHPCRVAHSEGIVGIAGQSSCPLPANLCKMLTLMARAEIGPVMPKITGQLLDFRALTLSFRSKQVWTGYS